MLRDGARGRSWLWLGAAVVGLSLTIAWHAWPWISDDGFISLRYAERFVAGHGLTWNDGERVEGYSNLLWVLLTAAALAVGIDGVAAVRGLGIAATVAALAVASHGLLRGAPRAAGLLPLALAAHGAVALWAIGGLEAPLAMTWVGLLTLGVWRGTVAEQAMSQRRWFALAGIALALLAWTRPDGPLWAFPAALCLFVFRRRLVAVPERPRAWLVPAAWLLAPVALAVLLQTGFRLCYYGDWVANTARAKLAPSWPGLLHGLDYVGKGAQALRGLLLPAAAGALLGWRSPGHRPLVLFAVAGVAAWCAYVAAIGGDYFPRQRVLLPVLLPLVALAAAGIAALAAGGRPARMLAWLLPVAALGFSAHDAARPPTWVTPLTRWEWDGVAIGRWLRRAFPVEQPRIALDAAGAEPWASRLPSLDMLGLCDRTIASTPMAPGPRALIGHGRGNGRYVLQQEPDLVFFTAPPHSPVPFYRSGRELEREPGFLSDYRAVVWEVPAHEDPHTTSELLRVTGWLRLLGRAGVRRSSDGRRWHVPGHVLGAYRQPYAFEVWNSLEQGVDRGDAWQRDLDAGIAHFVAPLVVGVVEAGRGLVGEVRASGEPAIAGLDLGPGRWRVHAPGLPRGIGVRIGDAIGVARDAGGVFDCELGPDGARELRLLVPAEAVLPFRVGELVLERVD